MRIAYFSVPSLRREAEQPDSGADRKFTLHNPSEEMHQPDWQRLQQPKSQE